MHELNSIKDIGLYSNNSEIFKNTITELAQINHDINDSFITYLNMHPYALVTDSITRLIDYPNNIIKAINYIWIFDSSIYDIADETSDLDCNISAKKQLVFMNNNKFKAVRYVGETNFFIYLASKSNIKFKDNYNILEEYINGKNILKLYYSRLILTLREGDIVVLNDGKIIMHGKEDEIKSIFNLEEVEEV